MKLWIDDERPPPDQSWTWVKNASDAMEIWMKKDPAVISFDHDLGDGGDTRMLAKSILGLAQSGDREPPRWYVHSANPVGKNFLEQVLERADRYWRHNQTQLHLQKSYERNK